LHGDETVSSRPPASIIINEVCVIPIDKTQPKWVELRNVSNETVNLEGWALNDSEKCLYKFKKDEKLASGALLTVLFYNGKERNFDFEQTIPQNVRRIIISDTKAYDREEELGAINEEMLG